MPKGRWCKSNRREFNYYNISNMLSFINDLDSSTIEALALTASRSQAPALRDLIYRHLTKQTSIGVDIPVSTGGFDIHSEFCSLIAFSSCSRKDSVLLLCISTSRISC
jgi:hypothetical protein